MPKALTIFKFHFESSSRSRANFCKLMQVCWRGIAVYAAMLLCSLYNFVKCGPLAIAACCLVIQCMCFREADLSVAPTKFMQLQFILSCISECVLRRKIFVFSCAAPWEFADTSLNRSSKLWRSISKMKTLPSMPVAVIILHAYSLQRVCLSVIQK
jgi:hypothetical protein